MKAIGYHFTMLTADMAVNGNLVPTMTKVKSAEEALEMAKHEIESGNDPYEGSYGYLIVYDDGSVSHYEFSTDELDYFPEPEIDLNWQNPDPHLRGLP